MSKRISKIIPSFFVDKASCTRQFESQLSLHSLASLFPIKEGFFRIPPSPFSQRELHLSHQASLSSGTRGCNRPTVLYMPHLSLPCGRVLTLYPSPKSLP